MKPNFTLRKITYALGVCLACTIAGIRKANAQITPALGNPADYIYGLTSDGEIDEIDITNGNTVRVIKNNTYTGNNAKKANGLAYNAFNGKFYYFKRNVGSGPEEFVSFDPTTGIVTILATSTCTDEIHTGCVSFDGTGYYTVDIQGVLSYYNIATNTWKIISSNIVDQDNNNVTSVIQSQNAGDMCIDGWGNIWIITSSNTNYALYKVNAPMPVNATPTLTVQRVIDPSTSTPNGASFAGIAFNAGGQIFMATKNGNRLYLLQDDFSLYYVGTLGTNDTGNDLTSQNFPLFVLPVVWNKFEISLHNKNTVQLDWEVYEENNYGFYVEYSGNGINWHVVGFVPAANDGSGAQAYTYSHANASTGKQFYRLRQVDLDGKQRYSAIRSIILGSVSASISVWPNPAAESVRINNAATDGNPVIQRVRAYDIAGQMVWEKQLQPGVNEINLSNLRRGTYILQFLSDEGILSNERLIKR